jgi:hypothetical protein
MAWSFDDEAALGGRLRAYTRESWGFAIPVCKFLCHLHKKMPSLDRRGRTARLKFGISEMKA